MTMLIIGNTAGSHVAELEATARTAAAEPSE
jgi:hypothetical protein